MLKNYVFFSLLIVGIVGTMYRESNAQTQRTPTADSTAGRTSEAVSSIHYTVSMSKPATHLLEVEMTFQVKGNVDSVDLKMPVWTPGSYLVREYARHLQDFTVAGPKSNSLPWQKTNKNTWRISTKGVKNVTINYRVYANELTVRTNDLNDEHAFWNNAALLLFPAGQLNSPTTISIKPYGDWKVATGLPVVKGKTDTFRADNYDILYDSPFEVNAFREISFAVRGIPHRIVVTGDGNYDLRQIAADAGKIAEEGIKIFGELPLKNYLFIVNLCGSGGLEHLNSTALQFNRFGFKQRASYTKFLSLVAHEYFHLWNVKRIRPDALGPFDYENENYTKLLWVAEGVTAYYEGLLLRRAGLITDKELLAAKAEMIRDLQNRPGRFETSLEEASMDAWIKYYRQDENAINNQVSYYDKGEIVAMMLDIDIRTKSAGKGSMDDVMRSLYNDFYKKNKNYAPADFQAAAEKAAGGSLDEFFSKYVRGEDEIEYDAIAAGIGLQLEKNEPNKGNAYIGADTTEENGRLIVKTVPAGTPAYEQGLNTGDQIIAVDGYRATSAFLQSYLGEKKPGNKIKLAVFRFDQLREISFTLGTNSRAEYAFGPVENPTEVQRRLYREYLGDDL